ncbi:Tyrosine-protein kinase wzc [Crateriforma conspicua]|uniref:non-specific protein-tyrosine kinase n=1 Tax=Crateriforma conspicua TaxID=2527996 RepID=A0A5C6FNC1_9PLAN|nr:polysaccharide biosynthesis tyrosine autokinase [Crateriforma conspicua]TWU64459.1 Tyrosine-protein kinase wzc [Crateriforma conspicua]
MNRSENEPADDDQLDIDLDLLGIVRRRYHLIALGILVGATLAVFFYVQQVPVYQSSLKVLVGQRTSELATTGTGNVIEGANSIQSNILATHVELFTSPKVIEDAILSSQVNRSVGVVSQNLSVESGEGGGASILTAKLQDNEPEVAALVLQAIYDSYKRYIDNQSRNVGEEAAELIANAQLENEKALRQADQEYREFVAEIPALVGISNSGQGELREVHRMRLESIEADLALVRKEIARAESRKAVIDQLTEGRSINDLTDTQIMSILDPSEITRIQAIVGVTRSLREDTNEERLSLAAASATVSTEYQKLLELTSRLRVLRVQFAESHPSVVAMKAEIENVQNAIMRARAEQPEIERVDIEPAAILQSYVGVLEKDLQELRKREAELLTLSEKESKLAKEVEMNYLLGNSLKANLDRARARYDVVFQRLQEINLTNDYSGFSTDLLVIPMAADAPIWPSKSKIAAMGLLAGGMLGLALALLAETVDRTFKNPQEVEKTVGAPIMAHIPWLDIKKLTRKGDRESAIDPMVATYHLPRGTEAETYRVIRTNVLLAAKKAEHQVFMITSPSPADGKSTTVANLAVSMAQAGKRVLLADADMRRPNVHVIFGVDREPGMADYLIGDATFDDCLHTCDQENLWVCPHGTRTSVPSELLETERFAQFLEQARDQFDIIFVDVPPILAVADPTIVGSHVDSCYLTIQIEQNNRTLVERAVDIFGDHGLTIEGVIVNSRKSRRNHYAYSSYNYYGKYEHGYQKTYRKYYESAEQSDDDAKPGKRVRRSSAKKIDSIRPSDDRVNGHATTPPVTDRVGK